MKNSRSQKIAILAITSALCFLRSIAEAGAPTKITLPDPKYPTVQDAVDALAPVGLLNLGTGTFTGPLVVNNKSITIVGATGVGVSNLVVVGPSANAITLSGDRTVLTVKNLVITGGTSGIASAFSASNDPITAPKLSATNLVVSGAGKGIFGVFHTLKLLNSRIRGCGSHGLSLVQGRNVTIGNTRFENNGGVGCLLNWNGSFGQNSKPVTISGCLISGNAEGGFEVQHLVGNPSPGANISSSRFTNNGIAGATSYGSLGIYFKNCEISSNVSDVNARWGNGVRVSGFYHDGVAVLTSCQISENEGAAICLVNDDNVAPRLFLEKTTFGYNGQSIVKWVATGSSSDGGVLFRETKSVYLPPKADGSTQVVVENLGYQLPIIPAVP